MLVTPGGIVNDVRLEAAQKRDNNSKSNATLGIKDCTISNNTGNGLYLDCNTTSTIENSSFSDNGGYGLDLRDTYGYIQSLTNCTISGNKDSGLFLYATITISGCQVVNNSGSYGGIYLQSYSQSVSGHTSTISNTIISDNQGTESGGIYAGSGEVTITGCTIKGNKSTGSDYYKAGAIRFEL